MSNRSWFFVACGSGLICVIAAIFLFGDNKFEVIVMVVSGAVAVFSANASGKAKIKELSMPPRGR